VLFLGARTINLSYPNSATPNIYTRVQQSSMEQIGREEGLSYDEIKGIFTHVNSGQKKLLGVS
jgi:hypothetical protein